MSGCVSEQRTGRGGRYVKAVEWKRHYGSGTGALGHRASREMGASRGCVERWTTARHNVMTGSGFLSSLVPRFLNSVRRLLIGVLFLVSSLPSTDKRHVFFSAPFRAEEEGFPVSQNQSPIFSRASLVVTPLTPCRRTCCNTCHFESA